MRQRQVALIKLSETFFRGAIVLFCAYGLPLEEAGNFGLVSTAISLFAFVLGYERYIDLQRKVAGCDFRAVHQELSKTLKFYLFQYAAILTPTVIALSSITEISNYFLFIIAIIVGEQIANFAYYIILIDKRFFQPFIAATVKSGVQFFAIIISFYSMPKSRSLESVLFIWAVTSCAYLIFFTLWWVNLKKIEFAPRPPGMSLIRLLKRQYRSSGMHFLIGLIAVSASQLDRLVVGGALSAVEVGIYFRNAVLAGLLMQIFGIVSYTRVAPEIYQQARKNKWFQAAEVIKIEYRRFAALVVIFLGFIIFIDLVNGGLAKHWGLNREFLAIVVMGVLLRSAADYKGLLLISTGANRTLLRNQVIALVLGVAGLFVLSTKYHLYGAFIGALFTPLLYFWLNRFSVQRRYGEFETLTP